MDTIPKEIVSDPIDLAGIVFILKNQWNRAHTSREGFKAYLIVGNHVLAALSAFSRLCLADNAAFHRSALSARRATALPIRKSSGWALASSSQVSGMETGVPGSPPGE